MSKTISTKLDEEAVKKLDEIAEKEHIDRSALIRKFLLQNVKEYEIKRMAELYRKGVISLQEAATQANVNLYEMMEYIHKENIRPPDQSKEEILDEIERSKNNF